MFNKKMIKKRLYLILICVSVLNSCKKHEVVPPIPPVLLPPATQTGANVVAWLTDSIPYIARGGYTSGTVEIDTSLNTGFLRVETSLIDNGGYKRAIRLNLPDNTPFPIVAGTSFVIPAYSSSTLFENLDPDATEVVLPVADGQIIITNYDLSKKIISGTFNFLTLPNTAGQSRIIKDGWFDLTFTLDYY